MRIVILLTLSVLLPACSTFPSTAARAPFPTGPTGFLDAAVVGPRDDGAYVVATNQLIQPAGHTLEFPGRPVDVAVHPARPLLAVKNRASLVFIDLQTRAITQTLPVPKGGNSVCGIAWHPDGSRVWTTDTQGVLRSARWDGAQFAWSDAIPLPTPEGKGGKNPAAAGFCLDAAGQRACVALSRNNSVAEVDLAAGRVVREIPVGMAPYTVRLHDGRLFVSNWGGRPPRDGDTTGPSAGSRVVVDPATGIANTGTVSVVDLTAGAQVAQIDVGLHPSGLALSPDGQRLYVANANSDTVNVIDTASLRVTATWDVRPTPEIPFGSAPNALAISPDGATLYAANGGNNALAVLDTGTGAIRGFVPTGWYPGGLALSADGSKLFIANTKGVGSRDLEINEPAKRTQYGDRWHAFNSHDHMGSVTLTDAPDQPTLEAWTRRVAENMRLPNMLDALHMSAGPAARVPVPQRPGEVSVFKHVIYVIKENRTYDQVFGDLPQGNGAPELCLFGREVTPNHHALAEEFVLLDNFYCNGVLSADGHQWTDEGYVTDYLEKSFGDFVRSYPYDGTDALAYASSGFIWDHVLRKGLTWRNYGEFTGTGFQPREATWTDLYRDFLDGTAKVTVTARSEVHTVNPASCPTFAGFTGKVPDVYRMREFLKEFRAFEASGELPNFITMLLPNDHTVGTTPGYPTPRAAVADNDLALGQLVEAVSKSPFWKDTVILVVEDDPQAGVDHVDGHRTVALCVSPYTRRGAVDSTFYNQTSMLRTIELIFGLAPMNQMTMSAVPMAGCFAGKPDLTPYVAKPNTIPLDEMNPAVKATRGKQRHYALKSLELPLDEVDKADEDTFNRIIWHSVKGYDTPYPKWAAARRSGLFAGSGRSDD